MEKLWNLRKTAIPMEKLWNFCFGGEKSCFLKKNGGKIRPDLDVVSMFVASVITSLGLALRTSRAIGLAYCWAESITASQCEAVNIVRPLSRLRQLALLSSY